MPPPPTQSVDILPVMSPAPQTAAVSAISQVFAARRDAGQMAFMPFLTAGDPTLDRTLAAIDAFDAAGADLFEIGVPYSDPIADGPAIQASYTRALNNGFRVPALMERLAAQTTAAPRIGMVSYSIVFRRDPVAFCANAKQVGLAGLIVPDLPAAEASELAAITRDAGLDLIQLVAPTTPRERYQQITGNCGGFVYCVAVTGVTGARAKVADRLLDMLDDLRQETDLPLAVGFGISEPSHIDTLRGRADGAIVGSAIVNRMADVHDDASMQDVTAYVQTMADACHRSA